MPSLMDYLVYDERCEQQLLTLKYEYLVKVWKRLGHRSLVVDGISRSHAGQGREI